jgi:hypothetical protein
LSEPRQLAEVRRLTGTGALASSSTLAAPSAPKLPVTGDIAAPLAIDLSGMPRQTATLLDEATNRRVSYQGVPLTEILKKAGLPQGKELRGKALAIYILAKAEDGYQVVFGLGELDPELTGSKVIVAGQREGQPLNRHEGPLRLVVDGDRRPARSVRLLEKLEIVRLRK